VSKRMDETPCRCGRDRYSEDGECAACPPENVFCPKCPAVIAVAPQTKRVVGPCPGCGTPLSIDL
jgi:hypothetical protein